jgi:lipopolysaccharide biosynthesis glycosyltransferase
MYLEYPENQWAMCNAGMFMIPKKYRTSVYFNHLIKIEKKFFHWIKYEDQSILTLWCQYFNIPISNEVKYNFQTTFETLKHIDSKDIKIVHFSGIKPDKEEFLKWNWINNQESLKNLFERY